MDAQDPAENLAALDPDIDLRALRAWLSMEDIPLGEFSDHVDDFPWSRLSASTRVSRTTSGSPRKPTP